MESGKPIAKTFYRCHRCQNTHETFTGEKVCKIVYGKKDPPQTVYKDENGDYRCHHYKGRW